MATPINKMGFLPQMSDTLAQIGLQALEAITYAAPIQAYPAAESKSEQIVGTAVAIMVMLSAPIKRVAWKSQYHSGTCAKLMHCSVSPTDCRSLRLEEGLAEASEGMW